MTSRMGNASAQQPPIFSAWGAASSAQGPAGGSAFPEASNPLWGNYGSSAAPQAPPHAAGGNFAAPALQPGSMPAGTGQTPKRLNRRVHRHRSQLSGTAAASSSTHQQHRHQQQQQGSFVAEPEQASAKDPAFQAAFGSLPPRFARAMNLSEDRAPNWAPAPAAAMGSSNPPSFGAGAAQPL